MEMVSLDIRTTVLTTIFLSLLGFVFFFFLGIRAIRAGRKLPFFRKRRDRMVRGWRMVLTAFGLAGLAFVVNRYAEPTVYHFFPPTATVTQTSTVTSTPTITLTPTISPTPTITNTPSVTNTPSMPEAIATQFESIITPNPEAVFSQILFARKVDEENRPVDPAQEFANPVGHMYGTFSFDKMTTGVQWSALWLRDGKLVYFESTVWNGGTGGYGYTDWNPPSEEWQPGEYEVQIFVGMEYKRAGRFTVTGIPPTSSPSPVPSTTRTLTPTISPSPTRTATRTATPTRTITPTRTYTSTRTFTPTRSPTATPSPTRTPTP